ncbi:MAG: DUF6171 family protein [Lachnospiraceae bacterium]|nr:DUF6171 family protein [Lachnospiraceae bacterium]
MGHIDGHEYRFCRMCDIIASIPSDVGAYADKLYSLLPDGERAGEELIRDRVGICEECDKNTAGTCLACGCYCAVRAMKKDNKCPKKKW